MQCIAKDPLLEHHPNTLEVIRKEYNLDEPGRMEDAIRILRDWIEKQQHFKKKNFSDVYLETTIIACKGSLERAKKQMDRFCTLRTLLPHFFVVRNSKTDFGRLFEVVTPVLLPKLTPEQYRVYMVKANNNIHLLNDYLDYFVYLLIAAEYVKMHDYCRGFIILVDFTETSIVDFLAKLNPVMIRQALSIFIEGYGMRIKGLYLYTPSKLIDTFVTLLKQLVSTKIADRIHSYKTLENIADIIPEDILPVDYGGKERPLRKIFEEWLDVLSSEEHLKNLKDMNEAGTDEACRQTGKFNEEYAGMPGTFRVLTVD